MPTIEEDIVELLLTIYEFPGQYVIGILILKALYDSVKNLTTWSFILVIFMFLFAILEILTPILAGDRLITKLKHNFKRIFG